MHNYNYDAKLDTTGLRCPQPIILTKQTVNKLSDSAILLIIASDPSFSVDCAVYSRQSGNQLLQSWQEGEQFYYLLQKTSRGSVDFPTNSSYVF